LNNQRALTWLKSSICNQAQLESEVFQAWAAQMGEPPRRMHRKVWEWCYIAQALHERGLLAPGSKGLGFAVGQEPLPELFASQGCTIVATDLAEDKARQQGWVDTQQHAANLAVLNKRKICDPGEFQRLVSFRFVDMRRLPEDLRGYDFIWSSCSFEHLGSRSEGEEFVVNAMQCLRPGGVAVHTTEFNLSSNSSTLSAGPTVLYRRRDIERLADHLKKLGHALELDFAVGTGAADQYVDPPPYKQETHLRLQIDKYVVTSIGLIIIRGNDPSPKAKSILTYLPFWR
jgi:2-polyprenyl-3-methyl-5-hydroxy-6-metoxy-1,4-benzoquinol methylase